MINLTSKQLRQAANLKEKIVALEKELNQLFGSTAKPVTGPAPKKRWKMSAKRKMSAAARAKIAAAAKARWKKAKAQGKNSL